MEAGGRCFFLYVRDQKWHLLQNFQAKFIFISHNTYCILPLRLL